VSYERTYYHDPAARGGRCPFDDELGVHDETSTGLKREIVKLCTRLPFEEAAEVHFELTRVSVSTTTAWRHTQEAGTVARPALHPMPTLKTTSAGAECLAISMDGCMANVRKEGWKEIKTGVIYGVSPQIADSLSATAKPDQVESVRAYDQSYVLHLGGPDGFGFKLAVEAQAREWSKYRQSAVLGDGAAWIWNLAQKYYPSAAHVVDWWHAKQHIYAAADVLHPNAPDAAEIWAKDRSDLLYLGMAGDITDELRRHAAQLSSDRLFTEAGYFDDNRERMQYQDFRNAGIPIGSGVVESGAKQTKHRVSAAGMRWSRQGLQNMLPLRAALMSGTFESLWERICPF
jgi:hypothetical protein